MREFLKTTLIGGGLVVVPIAIIVVVAVRLALTIRDAVLPLNEYLPIHPAFPGLLAVASVVALCFVTGLFVRTRLGDRIASGVERPGKRHVVAPTAKGNMRFTPVA